MNIYTSCLLLLLQPTVLESVLPPRSAGIILFLRSESYKAPKVHDTGHGHSAMADLFQAIRITQTDLQSSRFQRLSPLFQPAFPRQPTHQNYHYVLVSSHSRLEEGNTDSRQGPNVFILIPPPSRLCQRQTPTNTEHLNGSHQKDSILQEGEVTD